MTAIDDLRHVGQHVWLDDISTTILDDGTLERLRDGCGVTGVTANPTIFERAIGAGAYDERIRRSDGSDEDTFWKLALDDVVRAADLFAPAHRESEGRTGYVSIELSPHLADTADASVRQGVELFDRADRPNVMIKVPGTRAGVDAIEELTYLGVNVNVTLLFGLTQWQAAREAYLHGLERRLEEDRPLNVSSVASFFLSRIDHALDGDLSPDSSHLRHRAALASAAAVAAEWREVFGRDRWNRLADAGATPQQLLWASTSPKAEGLDVGYYAAHLAAPHTVITLTSSTLEELCGRESLDIDPLDRHELERSLEELADVERATRPLLDVADDLQSAGVRMFTESFESLIATIGDVRRSSTN